MKLRLLESLFLLLAVLVSDHLPVHAAVPLAKVLVTTGSASEREGALYVAQDQGFFRRYGLDLTLVQARNGPVGMAALSSGESFMHWGSVSGANLGAISEGADLIFVAGFINRLTGVFAANPKIRNPTDLKGKSLGVNSLSGGTWIFTMLTLDHWGLSPERDKIQMRGLGDSSIISQALLAGNIDAAYLSYSFAKVVENKGFSYTRGSTKIADRLSGHGDHHAAEHDRVFGCDFRKCD
jgi:NitT/TauT family transport system substrate-binding protein